VQVVEVREGEVYIMDRPEYIPDGLEPLLIDELLQKIK